VILHITTRAAWEAARAAGRYEAPSLAAEGFIHLSDPDQVVRVADARYSGVPDLVLLCVAPERLAAPLRYETSDAGEERFPHLYGAPANGWLGRGVVSQASGQERSLRSVKRSRPTAKITHRKLAGRGSVVYRYLGAPPAAARARNDDRPARAPRRDLLHTQPQFV
jgi:uncharacterized protein (DUF952 family)